MKAPHKLLALLDGSDQSLRTIEYIRQVAPFLNHQVVLFHVFTGIPSGFWDQNKEPLNIDAIEQMKPWEARKKKHIEDFMEQARENLIKAGFPKDAVEIKIRDREEGIARDIMSEAGQGYRAVVLSRRGMGGFEEILLGGVASKLISKLSFIPIIIAGENPPGDKILVGIDGSDHCIKAAEFAGDVFGGHGYKIELLHIIRGFGSMVPEGPEFMMPADFLEELQFEMKKLFMTLRETLIKKGFEGDKISEKIITCVCSRAESIVDEAQAESCGTIFVGRKGLSSVQEFFMGRVSEKIIHAGKNFTVWVV